MTAVKGSKQYKMMVIPYRPYYRVFMWLLFWLLMIALVAGSFLFGNFKGQELQAQAVTERDQLRITVEEKRLEAESFRQQVANLKLGSSVDRQASEGVRGEVIVLKEKIAALEEDISFYRGLMSPTANKRGLTIGSLNVISTGVPRQYEYKLVVQQLATNHQVLSGVLKFNVVGRKVSPAVFAATGETVTAATVQIVKIPLKDLSAQVSFENIKLRFKYFQNFQGQLVLPEGFEPQHIELLAKSSGKNAVTVEKKFGWLVQEG